MSYRKEFTDALSLLGQAFDQFTELGYERPVLVGGAAVEFYTESMISSGDFDITTPSQEALEDIFLELGFEHPFGAGVSTKGWVHPDYLIGVEVVANTPFEGRTDKEKLFLVDTGNGKVTIIPAEDIIADRMGQYNSGPRGIPEMLSQAIKIYRFAINLDEDYLERRIREETLDDLGLKDLKEAANAKDNTDRTGP